MGGRERRISSYEKRVSGCERKAVRVFPRYARKDTLLGPPHGALRITSETRNRYSLAVRLLILLAVVLFALVLRGATSEPPIVDRRNGEVRVKAKVQPEAMTRTWLTCVKGHHAIVWKGGRASRCALFVSASNDLAVRRALQALGAKPGENLTAATWHERENDNSPDPDRRVQGTGIDVLVESGKRRLPLASFLHETGTAQPRLDLRYGGNARWRDEFRSGCIVCLYSCPGGAIGNHAHTIRDYVRDGVVYSARKDHLPPAGATVTLIFKPRVEGK